MMGHRLRMINGDEYAALTRRTGAYIGLKRAGEPPSSAGTVDVSDMESAPAL
jgi:hypothetical protein